MPLLAGMLTGVAAATGAGPEEAAEVGRQQGAVAATVDTSADETPEDRPSPAWPPCWPSSTGWASTRRRPATTPARPVAFSHCPFAELAELHPEIVCHLHRGIVEGLVDGVGGARVAPLRDAGRPRARARSTSPPTEHRSAGTLGVVITLTRHRGHEGEELLEAEGEPGLALRVAVRPGGCSGFSYEMFFDSDVAADDQPADYDGVRVVVDPSSAPLLTGATLDYKDGLQQARVRHRQPQRPAHLRLRPVLLLTKSVGPYTPVVRAGDWLVVSGQVGVRDGRLVPEGTAGQLRQALANLSDLLEAEGASLADVVKTTVFLLHMRDYADMNEAYVAAFGDARPARSCVAVVELPVGALVEVEAWAYVGA